MFTNQVAHIINCDANLKRKRAPLFEQFVRKIEEQAFTDIETGLPLTYAKFSTAVKRFGYSGLTQINERHLEAITKHLFGPDRPDKLGLIMTIYLQKKQNLPNLQVSVDHLLRLSALLCSHPSENDQLNELWLLTNKLMEETVQVEAVIEIINSMAEIAIHSAILLLKAYQSESAFELAQQEESLKYLGLAQELISDFCHNFASNLPSELNFDQFSHVVSNLCLNSSQLRMVITQTVESQRGRDVVISQVSTLILAYLPQRETLTTGQHVCKKWYKRLVPQVYRTIPLSFTPWVGQAFRLRFESPQNEEQFFLGFTTGLKTDVREKCGRTNYASAGSTKAYQDFRWTIDTDGTLKAADGSSACLAAHRTYVSDCAGRGSTFLISTVYPGHENQWRLERYGDLEHRRFLISLKNSKCVKDNVNMVGWLVNAQQTERDENSCYVSACDRKQVDPEKMPVWQLELDNQ